MDMGTELVRPCLRSVDRTIVTGYQTVESTLLQPDKDTYYDMRVNALSHLCVGFYPLISALRIIFSNFEGILYRM